MSAARVWVRWAPISDLRDHVALLDERERERWAAYSREEDRHRFALGSSLVRRLVGELEGVRPVEVVLDRTCTHCGAPHGPVTTPDLPWRCSVSHSGEYAVAAVAAAHDTTALGIDLETRRPDDWRRLLRRVLADGEAEPADADAFVETWARKEAVLKATGEGLNRSMTTVRLGDGRALVDGGPTLAVADLHGLPATAALAVGADAVEPLVERA